MNDNQIDQLLGSYSENLGHFEGTVPSLQRKPIKVWKPILLTGTAFVAVGTFLLLPKSAEAAPMDKVLGALKNTKFWSATAQSKEGNGPWTLHYKSQQMDGKLRFDSVIFGGASRHLTTIIDSGNQYVDYSDLPYVLKSKFELEPRQNGATMTDPLKNALQMVGGMRKDFHREDGILYKGTEAYSLSMMIKKPGRKGFEVIVQKSTNLPLVVITHNFNVRSAAVYDFRIEYSYVQPNDLSMFTPNPHKVIVDVATEQKRWVDTWTPMIEGTQLPTVLSASMSPDGTIWLAYVSDGNQNSYVHPKAIDDKDYVPGVTYSLSDWKAAAAPRLKGKDVLVSTFLALNPKPSPKSSVTVEWQSHLGGDTPKSIKCQLYAEKWDFPSYFPPFMKSINADLQKNTMWRARGDAYRTRKMFKEAAEAYVKSYEIMKANHFFVNSYQDPLRAAAECYEKLGEKAKANELRKLMPKGPKAQY